MKSIYLAIYRFSLSVFDLISSITSIPYSIYSLIPILIMSIYFRSKYRIRKIITFTTSFILD